MTLAINLIGGFIASLLVWMGVTGIRHISEQPTPQDKRELFTGSLLVLFGAMLVAAFTRWLAGGWM